MPIPERSFAVLLYGRKIGLLQQRGAITRFSFGQDYLDDPRRPVLGLHFEESPAEHRVKRLSLPPWFSNLLPEERLRRWIAAQRGVPLDREVDLIAEVGHDLPGAVEVRADDDLDRNPIWADGDAADQFVAASPRGGSRTRFRFSLAGVTMKFSMVRVGERLTLPGADERGDWIVKFPDASFPGVPQNEYAMMSLAQECGLDVPEVSLRHRDELPELPDNLWPNGEEWAYPVRRFDRDEDRSPIHIEDLAQVRGFYPERKYDSNFETVAALVYRRHDVESLREFARRLAFNIIIGNSDAHLKNWSLIYRDRRRPTLSPAYDLVSTLPYGYHGLGMPWAGRTEAEHVTVSEFVALEQRLGVHAGLAEVVTETAHRLAGAWPVIEPMLAAVPDVRRPVAESVKVATRRLG
ncbi:MAG TPA: HipA domain-containing protein [Amycolatopsis sp.]|nr:HipA domain-containing protein [Amycolatopsis sp.]